MPYNTKEKENEYRRKRHKENPDKDRQRTAQWRKLNPEKNKARRKGEQTRRLTRLSALFERLKSGPCASCHNIFPSVCMDFHHRDPLTKHILLRKPMSMYAFANRVSENILLNEINKCDIICANCHRIITHI